VVTFDETKRSANLAKHGIDLAECGAVFDFPMLTIEDDRVAYGEQRFISLGWLGGRVVVMAWTGRKAAPHIISCRVCDKHETHKYFKEAV
jgi:uncharacterized DUF497 family protein